MAGSGDACRVLIVTARMGSGHLEVSRELGRRLTNRGHQVELVDLNQLMPRPTGRWLAGIYPWLVNRAPWLYDVIYRRFFLAPQRAGERAQVPVLLALRGLRRVVERVQPHVVVSTYHLAALAVARLREQQRLHCPAVTFITTFSVHNLWIHPAADAELCISRAAAQDAERRSGRPAEVCGPVVRAGFGELGPRQRLARRHELGIAGHQRVALVVAGSLGLGSVERAVTAIAAHPGWVPLVVCGRNDVLHRQMRQHPGVIALGWVHDMAAMMAASDVLVENAGGLSSKEALRGELPVVTFRPIAGHGRDDAQALARLGLTDLVEDERDLLVALDRLVECPEHRRRRVAGGRALFTGDAAASVVEFARSRQRRSANA